MARNTPPTFKFINRTREMKILEDFYNEGKPKLIILYGKRRVGKTEILNEFSKRHKALYLVARQESSQDQLRKMSKEIAEYFNDEVLRLNPFRNYDSLFTYLSQKEVPILLDEFPFLVESHKALPSILQEYWDKYFSKKKSFIILCGSSIRMMESLLGYKSPIYGRRTEQILIEPLKFREACKFCPKLSPEEKVANYAVLGGTPAYLLEFNYEQSLLANIKEKILQKNKFLYMDTQFVIQQELKEPSTYYSIINSIAKGNVKLGNIINDTGLEKGKITKYLSVLKSLHLIERRVPLTEKHPEKTRKGIYLLKDNYFKFWFRFIFENNEYIEQNMQAKLISEKINPELNTFIGNTYEEIALEWIKEQNQFKNYLIGRWWDKKDEIDILGIDETGNKIIAGEVKWSTLTQKKAEQIINNLKQKTERIPLKTNPGKEYILIAKKIENKNELKQPSINVFDLEDIIKSKD